VKVVADDEQEPPELSRCPPLEEGPPQLSRCPSPAADSPALPPTVPLSVSISLPTSLEPTTPQSTEPPQLVRSDPDDVAPPATNGSSPSSSGISSDADCAIESSCADKQPVPFFDNAVKDDVLEKKRNDEDSDSGVPELSPHCEDPEREKFAPADDDETTALEATSDRIASAGQSRRHVGSPDDTLDSISSSESQTFAGRQCGVEGIFERLMPTLTVDCDSSYGSTCGREGAPTSDSEGVAGNSGLDCNGSEKNGEFVGPVKADVY
jgi:hypothetical protein